MYRYPNFDPNVFTPRQLEVYERIASGQRKAVTGPLRIWLHNPELADLAQALGEYCRFGSALPPRLSELAIVTTAAHWRSGYEWAAHERHALNAGVSGDALCAIAANRAPSFEQTDAEATFKFSHELLKTGRVSDATWRLALGELGMAGVVDLVGILGYYGLISMTIAAFELPAPAGASDPFVTSTCSR